MDAIQLLKEDHEKVKKLFKEYESLGEKALSKKKDVADKILMELEIHAEIEEQIFYPRVKEATEDEDIKKLIYESFEEHKIVKTLVAELKESEEIDEVFEAKMKVLRESVEHHIKEEQTELFPGAKKAMKEELKELGNEMQAQKEVLKEEKAA